MITLLILSSVVLSTSVTAIVSGGLNNASTITYFYYDNAAPNVSIVAPKGTQTTRSGITLTTTINDTSGETCMFQVTDSNLNPHVGLTAYNCVSTTFTVSNDGDYTMIVNVSDGKLNSSARVNFTVTAGATPVSGGGGGGGGGSFTVITKEGNVSSILDFGVRVYTMTVVSVPNQRTDVVKVKNVGNDDVKNGKIDLTPSIDYYIDVMSCDESLSSCNNTFNLPAGKTGFLVINGTFDQTLGVGRDGFLRIIEESKTHELQVRIDRPSFYPLYARFSQSTGTDEFSSALIVYSMASLLIGASVYYGVRR